MFGLSSLATKIVAGLVIVALVLGLFWLHSCSNARKEAAQARLNAAQGQAATESGADAVNTVGTVSGQSQASDETTRSNEKDIRNAQGADAPVATGVRGAGFASLCKRPSFRAANPMRCTGP